MSGKQSILARVRRRDSLGVCLVLCLGGSAAEAQAGVTSTARDEVGHVVRVTDTTGHSLAGVLQSIRGDSLIIRDSSISPLSVRRFDVLMPLPTGERFRHGFVGFAVGGVLGAIAGAQIAIPQVRAADARNDFMPGLASVVDPILFGVLGGGGGFAIGYAINGRWELRWQNR